MGEAMSRMSPTSAAGEQRSFSPNRPRYETVEQVQSALQEAGFEACELIIGVSFARTNASSGARSFGGRCLHDVDNPPNPYMMALNLISRTLGVYDDDHMIPCYGFGDATTKATAVFSFFTGNRPANGLDALLERYKEIVPLVDMSGPTSFAPLIRQAMRDVYTSGMKFHVLLILADGQISQECLGETEQAIVDACEFPLSIVMVGIGDGPWNEMREFDHGLPKRAWDNFHFVEFNETTRETTLEADQRAKDIFELDVLEELPAQYEHCRLLTGADNLARVSHYMDSLPTGLLIDPPKA